jgi:UDP-3-O-[3-hydroxymyristoyl] glucosamine N-acyltransferase
MAYRAIEISEILHGHLEGDPEILITGLAKIEEANPGEMTFLANPKYEKFLSTTRASVIIVSESQLVEGKTVIRAEDPYLAFAKALDIFLKPEIPIPEGVHPTAQIGKNTTVDLSSRIGALVAIGEECKLGKNVVIYPGVSISDHVNIGDDSIIRSGVSIRHNVQIGNRVTIQDNSVIGSDGFGFAPKADGAYEKIPQTGGVIIEDDVEIGANVTIDRATLGVTRIEQGVKLDNLIQIAHNVTIGANTVIAAQTGISGSTKIGRGCMIAGQVGMVGHITLGDGTKVGAQSGVSRSFPENSMISGRYARPLRDQLYIEAALAKLPALLRRITSLEKEIAELKNKPSSE